MNDTCDVCKDWDSKMWDRLASHFAKLERDRKRKASVRAEKRARSVDESPKE